MNSVKFPSAPRLEEYIIETTGTSRERERPANHTSAPPGSGTFGEVGARNSGFASLAGGMRAKGLDEAQIAAGLAAINATLAEPLPDGEVESVARSISNYAAGFQIASDDVGLSRQIAARLAADFRVVGEAGWLKWTGSHWDEAWGRLAAQESIKGILDEFRDGIIAAGGDKPKGLASATRVAAMLKLTVSDPALQVDMGDLDADLDLFNVRNGILNLSTGRLSRTGQRRC